MSEFSSVPQLFLSPSVEWGRTVPYREPQSSVPVGYGGLSEEEKSTSVIPQCAAQQDTELRKNGVVSNVNLWDRDGLTIPRQFRDRFGPGVKLTFHVEPGSTRGRMPYWWHCHD